MCNKVKNTKIEINENTKNKTKKLKTKYSTEDAEENNKEKKFNEKMFK